MKTRRVALVAASAVSAALALKVRVPSNYPFVRDSSRRRLTFSTPGCWKVVARIGRAATFTFVVRVAAD